MQIKFKNIAVVATIMCTLIGTITGVMTYVNLQPTQNFLTTWFTSFVFALLVMLPIGGLIFAAMNKLVNQLFPVLPKTHKKLTHGILMAVVMESIMAIVTTVLNHDYVAFSQTFDIFITSFLFALPVGLTFACLMTFVLHPKLERLLAQPTA